MYSVLTLKRGIANTGCPVVFSFEGFLQPGESAGVVAIQPVGVVRMEYRVSAEGLTSDRLQGEGSVFLALSNTSTTETKPFCVEMCVHAAPTFEGEIILSAKLGTDPQRVAGASIGQGLDPFNRCECFTHSFDAHRANALLMCLMPDEAECLQDLIACGFNWSHLKYLPELIDQYIEDCLAPEAPVITPTPGGTPLLVVSAVDYSTNVLGETLTAVLYNPSPLSNAFFFGTLKATSRRSGAIQGRISTTSWAVGVDSPPAYRGTAHSIGAFGGVVEDVFIEPFIEVIPPSSFKTITISPAIIGLISGVIGTPDDATGIITNSVITLRGTVSVSYDQNP